MQTPIKDFVELILYVNYLKNISLKERIIKYRSLCIRFYKLPIRLKPILKLEPLLNS
jgi:hypothetical protein